MTNLERAVRGDGQLQALPVLPVGGRPSVLRVEAPPVASGQHAPAVAAQAQEQRLDAVPGTPLADHDVLAAADGDAERLRAEGIAAVYTPKDFELDNIMSDLIDLVDRQNAAE